MKITTALEHFFMCGCFGTCTSMVVACEGCVPTEAMGSAARFFFMEQITASLTATVESVLCVWAVETVWGSFVSGWMLRLCRPRLKEDYGVGLFPILGGG